VKKQNNLNFSLLPCFLLF